MIYRYTSSICIQLKTFIYISWLLLLLAIQYQYQYPKTSCTLSGLSLYSLFAMILNDPMATVIERYLIWPTNNQQPTSGAISLSFNFKTAAMRQTEIFPF